jgi:hypothetical protein
MQSWFVPHSTPKAPKMAAPAAGAQGSGVAGVAPGTSPDDFKRNQTAQYQQMLAGLGMGQEGGSLPEGIQTNIDRQASLLQQG